MLLHKFLISLKAGCSSKEQIALLLYICEDAPMSSKIMIVGKIFWMVLIEVYSFLEI
jgi:hypothetical protein